jgi:Holliday junction resolvase RusA-like endonuclease
MKRTQQQHQLSISTTADDYEDMRLSRETDDHVVIARFTVEGEPVSKARARFTKYGSKVHTYTPEKTMQAERAVAWTYRQTVGATGDPSSEETFGLLAQFYNGTQQRRDVDNMLKLLLDGLNGVAWADDMQVMEVSARKHYVSKAEARTEVVVYSLGLRKRPERKCQHCGQMFRVYPSWPSKVYCTDDCRLAQRRAARRKTCETCGKQWDPGKPSEARFCSKDCKKAANRVEVACSNCGVMFSKCGSYLRANNYCSGECTRAAARSRKVVTRKGDCRDCGGPVSKAQYLRCKACALEFRSALGTKGAPEISPK